MHTGPRNTQTHCYQYMYCPLRIHTLYMTPYCMRSVLGVGVGGLEHVAVEMLATLCVRKLWGDARPSP